MNPYARYFRTFLGETDRPEDPPFSRHLGGVLRMVEEGRIRLDYTVRPEWANPVGLLHGGMHCALIDETIGFAALTLGRRTFYMSVSLNVDYLGPAKVGEVVSADARIVHRGNRVLNAECEIVGPDGRPLSRGTSNLVRSHLPALEDVHRKGSLLAAEAG